VDQDIKKLTSEEYYFLVSNNANV